MKIQIQQIRSPIQTGKARYKKEDPVTNAYDDLIQILASDHLLKDNVTKLITKVRLSIKTSKSRYNKGILKNNSQDILEKDKVIMENTKPKYF